jgi:hypothetical protein
LLRFPSLDSRDGVIAGLDPAIHPEMDPRVKPAGDGRGGVQA